MAAHQSTCERLDCICSEFDRVSPSINCGEAILKGEQQDLLDSVVMVREEHTGSALGLLGKSFG